MNKKIISLGFTFTMLLVLVVSFSISNITLAQSGPDSGSGLVPCGTVKYKVGDTAPNGTVIPATKPSDSAGIEAYNYLDTVSNPCGFNEFMELINGAVNFILFTLAVPLAAIMFAYAGGLLLFAGGEVSKVSQAKKIFTNVAIGLILAAGAWLIVNSVLSILGYDGSWIGF